MKKKLLSKLMASMLAIGSITFTPTFVNFIPMAHAQETNKITYQNIADMTLKQIIENGELIKDLEENTIDVKKRMEIDKDDEQAALLQEILTAVENQDQNRDLDERLKNFAEDIKKRDNNKPNLDYAENKMKKILKPVKKAKDAKVVLNKIIDWYKDSLEQENKNNYVVYKNRAKAYQLLHDYNNAIQSYSMYINEFSKSKPKNETDKTEEIYDFGLSKCYLERGKIFYKLEDYPQAFRDFDEAVKYNKNNDEALFYRSVCNTYIYGEREQAKEDMRRAIAVYNEGKIDAFLTDFQDNSKELNEVIKNSKQDNVIEAMQERLYFEEQDKKYINEVHKKEGKTDQYVMGIKYSIEDYYEDKMATDDQRINSDDENLKAINTEINLYLEFIKETKDQNKVAGLTDSVKKYNKEYEKYVKYKDSKKQIEKNDKDKADDIRNTNEINEKNEKIEAQLEKLQEKIDGIKTVIEYYETNNNGVKSYKMMDMLNERALIDLINVGITNYQAINILESITKFYDNTSNKDNATLLRKDIETYLNSVHYITIPVETDDEKKQRDSINKNISDQKRYLSNLQKALDPYISENKIENEDKNNLYEAIEDYLKGVFNLDMRVLKSDGLTNTINQFKEENILDQYLSGAIQDYKKLHPIKKEITEDKIALTEKNNKNLQERHETLYYTLNGYLITRSKKEQAIKDLNTADKVQTTEKYNDLCYKYLGDLYSGSKSKNTDDYQIAINNYDKVITMNLTSKKNKNAYLANVYNNRGLCYKKLGDKKSAKIDFGKARELGYEKEPSIWDKVSKGVSKAKKIRSTVKEILSLFLF